MQRPISGSLLCSRVCCLILVDSALCQLASLLDRWQFRRVEDTKGAVHASIIVLVGPRSVSRLVCSTDAHSEESMTGRLQCMVVKSCLLRAGSHGLRDLRCPRRDLADHWQV